MAFHVNLVIYEGGDTHGMKGKRDEEGRGSQSGFSLPISSVHGKLIPLEMKLSPGHESPLSLCISSSIPPSILLPMRHKSVVERKTETCTHTITESEKRGKILI